MIVDEIEVVQKLLVSVVLSLPIAWNREKHTRIAGLRTYPLVAAGACAYTWIGVSVIGPIDAPDASARVVAGLLTGIGFLGGGAILKSDREVQGTASAAAIWITGAIGCAVAFDLWLLSATLSMLSLAVFLFLGKVKKGISEAEMDE
ncbi:MAG: MgtC/SapB family protein [Verrucomicrobiaceae bacterium]